MSIGLAERISRFINRDVNEISTILKQLQLSEIVAIIKAIDEDDEDTVFTIITGAAV